MLPRSLSAAQSVCSKPRVALLVDFEAVFLETAKVEYRPS
jgi:hypothetical protein